ncbi:Hypothetical protein BN2458_PEG0512 [Helicobacter typhlonius]|uniref:Uncharacterized protein n=1 Tax=Helicobacter typhlonius TaxID=76936 RepID=A0A0S4PUH7_9HELI|nr:Hypothetical protein BN2458_PEG0512 [Helicobacter typhlonius]
MYYCCIIFMALHINIDSVISQNKANHKLVIRIFCYNRVLNF